MSFNLLLPIQKIKYFINKELHLLLRYIGLDRILVKILQWDLNQDLLGRKQSFLELNKNHYMHHQVLLIKSFDNIMRHKEHKKMI